MKEIKDILQAYGISLNEGKQTALATVVHVEGSSYRRPGARMLVTEDGQLTGAISGGCLEGDALRKALLAINQKQNKLVTYDTTDEDDAKFGVQLGCNGIVHILFEPIGTGDENNVIYLLKQVISTRQDAVLTTLFSLKHTSQPGTRLLYRQDKLEYAPGTDLPGEIIGDAKLALQNRCSSIKIYQQQNQPLHAFMEFIAPPVALVVAGAGNDVQPLVEITSLLGWQVTVMDGRPTHATQRRFPKADRTLVATAEDALSHLKTDHATVFVLMTHNYNYDLALLTQLLAHNYVYIGILGPRKKLDRMLAELNAKGIFLTETQLANLYSPVGLDIGAETSEEIALSVVAEIKAVLANRPGASLKVKQSSIHSRW